MIASVGNTLSALNAFQKKMEVTSNNIANVDTDGFKRSDAVLSENATGGVKVTLSKDESPGPIKMESYTGEETEMSNVDLAEELTDTITTEKAYSANLKTFQTQDEMLGDLMNILA